VDFDTAWDREERTQWPPCHSEDLTLVSTQQIRRKTERGLNAITAGQSLEQLISVPSR